MIDKASCTGGNLESIDSSNTKNLRNQTATICSLAVTVIAPKAHLRRRERIPTATFLPVLVFVRPFVRAPSGTVWVDLGWIELHDQLFPF